MCMCSQLPFVTFFLVDQSSPSENIFFRYNQNIFQDLFCTKGLNEFLLKIFVVVDGVQYFPEVLFL